MKLNHPNLYITELRFDKTNYQPDIDDKIVQSLSYLIGQDKTTEKFHILSVNENGELQATLSLGVSSVIDINDVSVLSSVTTLISANSSRVGLKLQNKGGSPVYISADSGMVVGEGLILSPNESIDIGRYTGALYGIVVTSSVNVAVMEYT